MAEPCLFKNRLCQKRSRRSFLLSRLELILPGAQKNQLFFGPLTGAVIGTRWWAGRGQRSITESCRGVENCQKTRRLPLVGCTLCWAALGFSSAEFFFSPFSLIFLWQASDYRYAGCKFLSNTQLAPKHAKPRKIHSGTKLVATSTPACMNDPTTKTSVWSVPLAFKVVATT